MKPEPTLKWAAILWLVSGTLWIVLWAAQGLSGRAHFAPEYLIIGAVHVVVGVAFARAWSLRRGSPWRIEARRLPLLAPSPLVSPNGILALSVLAALSAVLVSLVTLLT